MTLWDKVRDLAGSNDDEGTDKTGSPAAAAGGGTPGRTSGGETGEVSQAGSSFGDSETSTGGADAVPGTPDAVPATKLGEGSSEDVTSNAPSESVSTAERDDV